jgi:xanthine dehydrogenase YagT iron-sulfur-binding subunit
MAQGKKDRKRKKPDGEGISRRDFLATAGIGAAGAVAAAGGITVPRAGEGPAAPAVEAPEELVRATLRVNGRTVRLLVEPRWSLLHVLRERLGLTGTKAGCERGECGACTVLIDGRPRYACLTLALEAEGTEISTPEGLMRGEELGETQRAFVEHDAFQCGYCTPGQVMAVEGLLRINPKPTTEEIRIGVSGNLCRCGAYANIFKAAQRAAELKRSGSGS